MIPPGTAFPQKPIVIAAALTQPVPGTIKCHARHEDQIDCLRLHNLTICIRFQQAKCAANQIAHMDNPPRRHDSRRFAAGQNQHSAVAQNIPYDIFKAQFAPAGHVSHDAARLPVRLKSRQLRMDCPGGLLLRLRRKQLPHGAYFPAQLRFIHAHTRAESAWTASRSPRS